MKCVNCSSEAVHEVVYPSTSNALYCGSCLPKPLRALAVDVKEEPKKKKRKAQDAGFEDNTGETSPLHTGQGFPDPID